MILIAGAGDGVQLRGTAPESEIKKLVELSMDHDLVYQSQRSMSCRKIEGRGTYLTSMKERAVRTPHNYLPQGPVRASDLRLEESLEL